MEKSRGGVVKVSMEFQGVTVSGNGYPQRGYGLFMEKPDASIGKKILTRCRSRIGSIVNL